MHDMLFKLEPPEKPVLQRQLDADQHRWSRQLELETDAEFGADEMKAFHMHGLFGLIPGNNHPPYTMNPRA